MNIENLIGNTPIIEIKVKYQEKIVNVYAKLEYYNYTGSIKDRLAYYIIKESYKDGSLKECQPIVEATSGNTGISFASLGAYFGHEVHIFMPDWASQERVAIMKLYGAKVYLVSKEDGGFKRPGHQDAWRGCRVLYGTAVLSERGKRYAFFTAKS